VGSIRLKCFGGVDPAEVIRPGDWRTIIRPGSSGWRSGQDRRMIHVKARYASQGAE
jgi:hypothetical protein